MTTKVVTKKLILKKPIRNAINKLVEIAIFALFTALFIIGYLQYFRFI